MTIKAKKAQLNLLEIIKTGEAALRNKTVSLGFDAFVDSVVKVIRQKDVDGKAHYFESTLAFGEYIVDKGKKSFSIEMEEITNKLGGNMPIMANAVAQMGPKVSCIGPMGRDAIHPVFRPMQEYCELYSYADPGLTKVLEFPSGKIMMAEMTGLNNIPWEFIRDSVGVNTFLDLFSGSDLIAVLNWSELDNSTAIWQGLLRDVLNHTTSQNRPVGFFDLSDCSKREATSIREALSLLSDFSHHWDIVLSLNLNEASILTNVFGMEHDSPGDIKRMCEYIFAKLNIHTVIIHTARSSVAMDSSGLYAQNSFYLDKPIISSGAGDNFNAGYAIGRLLDLQTEACLTLGNATSALYMRSTKSPSIDELVDFLSNNLSTWNLTTAK
jgi:sugar/nucleoside kinase (ribokinase family)